ncbi:phenylalanyl-tRNA synthetase subunit beta [Actinobaculum suis]|uniref:Phenylalanine--tRNA ligase beta subunit n=1 Tax=Actinobaculum suis TaxID=1657 RepID=A0A7Z9C9I2_9ACTO|nr:phenylalanine--tRNA ligase subunit beta [Actinobaculum suis]VDG76411.1 phenylalanyl-tRNA synthetase subunit beta [Actinobaculum suis]
MPLIPIDWLGQHVELPADLTAAQLARDLVKVGLEEEEIHPGPVQGPVVVGKVLSREAKKQSNGKVINYCRVDVGAHNDAPGEGKEPADVASRGIICGAHNFEVGDYVVVSLPGAVLPGDFQISARKTYGHISDGMICSFQELGLEGDSSGIIVLAGPSETEKIAQLPAVGEDVLGYLGIPGETLEINVTPDRGYCFSMRGVAREYHHSTGAAFRDPGLPANLPAPLPPVDNAKAFPVEQDDQAPIHGVKGCERYVARIVRGVDPAAPSPKWMRDRLTEAGMRPISLAVDATNYVMLDLGQPMHAYDLDKLTAPIVVRRATPGEKLVTLDEVTRTLDPEDLLITDSEGGRGARAIGLAGVMGGESTEISDSTRNILLEAGVFEPVTISRTARRHRLHSEASKRFERGIDAAVAAVAMQKVVDILVEYGGGTADPVVGDYGSVQPMAAYRFPVAEVARLLGLEIPVSRVRELLEDIGCAVVDISDDAAAAGDPSRAVLEVTPPTWRHDLTGPAHFVEEVARLVGYDEIPSRVPQAPAGSGLTARQRQRRDISRTLAEAGWVQVLSYPFVGEATFDKEGLPATDSRRTALRLQNPLQEEKPLLRTSILDSLLDTAALNVRRGNPVVAIFETGHVVHPAGITPAPIPQAGKRPSESEIAALHAAIPSQPHHVAGIACGQVTENQAGFTAVTWDWRDAIDAARRVIGLSGEAEVRAAERAPWHPGRCAQLLVAGKPVGYAGELAPAVCRAFDLPKRSVAFEIDTDAVFENAGTETREILPVLTYPAAKEDLAFIVDNEVRAADVEACIRQAAGALLEDLRLFDVYTGDQIPEGKKSLAYALRFRADHTLKADEVAALRKKVVKAMAKKFKAELRA